VHVRNVIRTIGMDRIQAVIVIRRYGVEGHMVQGHATVLAEQAGANPPLPKQADHQHDEQESNAHRFDFTRKLS
jgi:hypothetical protein